MDSIFRLVHLEGRHDRGQPWQGLASAHRNERQRAPRTRTQSPDHHLPEGTRRAPGAEPRYKYGVVHLYAETKVACLPVALNSGLFWPRRSFRRYPGTIRVEILDPIPPGLGKDAFFDLLQHGIEAATARLVAEGARELAENGIKETSFAPSP